MNHRNRFNNIPLIGFITGFLAISLQLSFIRESLTIYQTSEIFIAWIIGLWLLFTSTGNLVAKYLPCNRTWITITLLLFCLWSPLCIWIYRLNPLGANLLPGELLQPTTLIATTALLLAPVCLLNGVLFTLPVRFIQKQTTNPFHSHTVSRPIIVYISESAGSLIGALLITWFLPVGTHYFLFYGCVTAVAGVCFTGRGSRKTGITLLLTGFLMMASNGGIENHVNQSYWSDIEDQSSFSSPYGRFDRVVKGAETIVYFNREPLVSSDIQSITETICCLCQSTGTIPQSIVILEGTLENVSPYFCHNPSVELICLTQDISPWEWYNSFPLTQSDDTNQTLKCLSIHQVNPRYALRNFSPESVDVILCRTGTPNSLANSRFYTQTFYQDAFRALSPGGQLVFTIPGSETSLNPQNTLLAKIVHNTLTTVFPESDILCLPGDPIIVMAGKQRQLSSLTPKNVLPYLQNLPLTTTYPQISIIEHRLNRFNRNQLKKQLSDSRCSEISTDDRPMAFAANIELLNSFWDTGLQGALRFVFTRAEELLGLVVILTLSLFLLFYTTSPETHTKSFYLLAGVSGCTVMASEVMLLFHLQTSSGALYRGAGLLIACCTCGLTVGALISDQIRVTGIRACQILAINSLLLGFTYLFQFLPLDMAMVSTCSLATLFGAAGGVFFGSVAKVFPERITELYISELAGAAFGSIIIGLFLLPAAGFLITTIALVSINAGPLFLLKFCEKT